ncbi:MAG TPA: serine hydrolase [Gemmatimonadaceae bacterium]|nr:serine hydrolase [Gemmatimonadaceae bacterium]
MSLHRRLIVAAQATLLVALAACDACTSYRIIRYREPDARNQSMFPSRVVGKADAPWQFARATSLRTDLDTVSVRTPNAARVPFAKYMADQKVLAFVAVRNDTIVYETYRDGLTASTIHSSFSVAKSVLSALVGIAVGEGRIRSLDDRVTDYIPELRGRAAFDGVTIRHLLEMKSGLRYTEAEGGMWKSFRSDEARIYYATDLEKAIAESPRVAPPGATWVYKDTDAELLGWVLSRATGRTVAQYTEEKLWRRIGAEHDATWSLDRDGGHEKVSSGFNAVARDFARFGRLYLNGGSWNGEQVVPADWVARSVAVDTTRAPEISTWWQMQHTLYWWHPIQPPARELYADGSHGQRIYVDPASRTVIVQLANESRQDFPFRRIVAYLNGTTFEYPRSIPALVRQAAVAFGTDSARAVFTRLEAERRLTPERFVITERAMITVGTVLADSVRTRAAGVAVLELASERYPRSAGLLVALGDAYLASGDRVRAADALRRAMIIAPNDSSIARRAASLGVR